MFVSSSLYHRVVQPRKKKCGTAIRGINHRFGTFANHNSHGDFILLWVSLPYQVRKNTRPVAGADYWTKGPIRRFFGV